MLRAYALPADLLPAGRSRPPRGPGRGTSARRGRAWSPVIVAVTLDPAVHVSYDTKLIVPGTTHQVGRVRYRAGGRGPAVARMLHTFGHEVVAAGLAGGTAGELIRAELARRGVPTQFTPIAMESRRVVEVTDSSTGTTTSFAEPSPYITTEELGRLAADYRGLLDGASAVVLCGGLPDGLPPETYGTFATYAAEAGVPVVLDAGGSALRHGAARRPALVIPEPSAGDPGQAAQGARPDEPGDPGAMIASGVGAVATLSGHTVSVLTDEGEWRAWLAEPDWPAGPSPDGTPGGPGLSRDALVAGFVPGVALHWSWPDSLQHAVSLAASVDADGKVDLVTYERLLPLVVVEPAPVPSRA
jgi:tagatose 6-phosphate kinase